MKIKGEPTADEMTDYMNEINTEIPADPELEKTDIEFRKELYPNRENPYAPTHAEAAEELKELNGGVEPTK